MEDSKVIQAIKRIQKAHDSDSESYHRAFLNYYLKHNLSNQQIELLSDCKNSKSGPSGLGVILNVGRILKGSN